MSASAIDLGRVNPHNRGNQRLYRVDGGPLAEHAYVVVSAAVAFFEEPEALIFAADHEGNVSSYLDLTGSQRGTLDHEKVLRDLGYEVVAHVTIEAAS